MTANPPVALCISTEATVSLTLLEGPLHQLWLGPSSHPTYFMKSVVRISCYSRLLCHSDGFYLFSRKIHMRNTFICLHSLFVTVVENYYKFSGLKPTQIYHLIVLEVQKPKMGFPGLKSRCQQSVFSGGSRKDPVSLTFPSSRGCMHASACGSFPPPSKSAR